MLFVSVSVSQKFFNVARIAELNTKSTIIIIIIIIMQRLLCFIGFCGL